MSDRMNQKHFELNEAAVIVAVVGRDAREAFIINACNEAFARFSNLRSEPPRVFPVPFDNLTFDPSNFDLRAELDECFRTGRETEANDVCETQRGRNRWRVSLKPLLRSSSKADEVRVHEVLVTGTLSGSNNELTHQLEVSDSRFRAVVDSAYDAIVSIDEHHRITLFNRAAENLFGYASAEMLGQPIETLLPERFRANHSRNVRQFADSPLTSLRSMTAPRMDETNSVFGRHRDGTIIPVEIAISKINIDGVVEFTAVIRDITERAELIGLLKKQASTDALTGLPNRREFVQFVQKALGTDDTLSIFILDIDNFKKINDSYGHDIGDEVLCVLAEVGLSIPGNGRLFARWGGEEFVAALPGVDLTQACRIADALRERIAQRKFEHVWRDEPIAFTVSVGVVTRDPQDQGVDTLMRRADRALYRAKEAGRNRVVVGE
jgi:diguanylate cyclase (GGDEF)-like protein/PAS domain S-box-containing protein